MLAIFVKGTAVVAVLIAATLFAAVILAAIPFPKRPPETDVFGFDGLPRRPVPDPATLRLLRARDGGALRYRLYDAPSERILIFLHGSSYHGGGYEALARHMSEAGLAKVVLPNLRGHFLSGQARGDVDHIGQYEEDLVDLIRALRTEGHQGPIILGGHSSGGGLVIRFAGGDGPRQEAIAAYFALAPIIPRTTAVRGGNAGGWNVLHMRRIIGLVILNMLGIHGLDGLPVIAFNKPAAHWDGTETLAYSWRLNLSYHPRNDPGPDIRALSEGALILVGADDEAVDGQGLKQVLAGAGYRGRIEQMEGISHFGIFSAAPALDRIADFVAAVSVAQRNTIP